MITLDEAFNRIVDACKNYEIGDNGYRHTCCVVDGVKIIINVNIDDRRNMGCCGCMPDWRKEFKK